MLRSFVEKRNLTRLQLLIASGVLAVSFYLAIVAARAYTPESLLMDPVFLLLIVASIIVFLIARPIYGLVFLIIVSLVSLTQNSALMRYTNPAILLLFLLLALWILDSAIIKRKPVIFSARPFLPLLILVISAVISFGVGQLRWFTFARPAPLDAQIAGLALFILSAGAFVLAAVQIIDYTWLKRLTWLFLIVGGTYIVILLIPGPNMTLRTLFTKAVGTSIFWIWLVALSFSQSLFNKELHIRWRILLAGLTIAALMVAMVRSFGWKSGWMPPLIALLVIIYFRSPKLAIGAIVVVAAFLLIRNLSPVLIQDDEYSYLTRVAAWEIILGKIYTVSPIFGLGPANYRFYTPLFSILGYNIQFNSHNNYIDILAQIGLVGLAAFVWFFFEVFRLGWALRARVSEGFALAYVNAALAGLIATLISGFFGDWIVPFIYNIGIHGFQGSLLAWFFLGGLVALDRIMKEEAIG